MDTILLSIGMIYLFYNTGVEKSVKGIYLGLLWMSFVLMVHTFDTVRQFHDGCRRHDFQDGR